MDYTDDELKAMGLTDEEIAALKDDEGDGNGEGNENGEGTGAGNGDQGDGKAAGPAGEGEGDQSGKQPDGTADPGAAAADDAAAGAAAAGDQSGAASGALTDEQKAEQEKAAAAAKQAQERAKAEQDANARRAEAEADANKQQVDKLNAEKAALRTKFNEGEISFDEYETQRDAITEQLDTIREEAMASKISARIRDEDSLKNWYSTAQSFVDQHPMYAAGAGSLPYQALNTAVLDEQRASVANGGSTYDPAILQRAHARVLQQFGISEMTAGSGAQGGTGGKPPVTRGEPNVPPNIGKLPASNINDTDTSRFAHLDRLAESPDPDNPDAYEKALAKMSREDRDAYLAR